MLERQLLDTEQAIFGAKLFLWGKLYGFVTAIGADIIAEKDELATLERSWIMETTWEAVESRKIEIRRVIQG